MSVPSITDAEILMRMKTEDSFVELKVLGQWKDGIRTCVAFANSCSGDGPPGLLCVGIRDDGTVEPPGNENLDNVQKNFERRLEEAYPPIRHETRVIQTPEGKFLAVIVPGSSDGPHFAGPAYVRVASSTVKANADQFARIIDKRERKIREILKWKDKPIKLERMWVQPSNLVGRIAGSSTVIVMDCDAIVVKLKSMPGDPFYLPLKYLVLSRDSQTGALIIQAPQD